jgi:5-methyltetrahydrofolate--homocysteine methyltransferase
MDLINRLKNTKDVLLHYFPLHSALVDWGKPLEVHLSEWIINHPEEAQDAWKKSFEAGCDFASTSTQASSPWRANVFGLRDKTHELNYRSAKLAREVTPAGKYLGGFVSSTNPDFIEPVGLMTEQEIYDGYKEQISALLEGGVDLIMVVGNQTNTNAIAAKVTKDISNVPVLTQNVFYFNGQEFRTLMGHDVKTASKMVADVGTDIIGASCGLMRKETDENSNYYEGATRLVRELKSSGIEYISIQPNAGLAQLHDGNETVYPASPDDLAIEAPNWVSSGARVIGGCCGTSLDHYRKLAKLFGKTQKTGVTQK